MSSILKDQKIKAAIQEIALRTEQEDPAEANESFYDCNIISHFLNFNHQIIQGRRGTGKTHILVVLKKRLEKKGVHCIIFDCKATGSAADVSDVSLPEKHRMVQLMRDFLLCIHQDLRSYFNESMYMDTKENSEIIELLDHLFSECYAQGTTENKFENNNGEEISTHDINAVTSQIEMCPFPKGLFGFQDGTQKNRLKKTNKKMYGHTYEKVVFPNIFHCLNRLGEISQAKFVILIDEWSNLPLDIQPHFAEFLRRCIMPSRFYSLKIAVVKGRTKYCIKDNRVIYGFEVGADIAVSLDLDTLYMYDRDPRKVFSDLYKILWTHLRAKHVLNGIEVGNFLSMLFDSQESAILLVRASEGNPRDFICIIHNCIILLDGMGSSDSWIDSKTVFEAAKLWFDSDKAEALTEEQKKVLNSLVNYVVRTKKNRGLVLEDHYLDHPIIKNLIDARVLHVAQTGRHFECLGNSSMAILILDFGTYSTDLNEGKEIHFLWGDPFEQYVFLKWEPSNYDNKLQKFDKYRYFQMCFWDPALPSKICPEFNALNK